MLLDSPPTVSSEGEAVSLIKDLEVSISALERSNKELEVFLQENGHQQDLRQAIGENVRRKHDRRRCSFCRLTIALVVVVAIQILIIARRKAILADLRKQAGMVDPDEPSTAPTAGAAAMDVGDGGVYL
jgi:hypothetical protein